MYLNLLYKSIKADPERSPERKKALIKRFVQVLASGGSGAAEFVAGGLYLLGEVSRLLVFLIRIVIVPSLSSLARYLASGP